MIEILLAMVLAQAEVPKWSLEECLGKPGTYHSCNRLMSATMTREQCFKALVEHSPHHNTRSNRDLVCWFDRQPTEK